MALEILTENREKLDALAARLIEIETMGRDDVERLLRRRRAPGAARAHEERSAGLAVSRQASRHDRSEGDLRPGKGSLGRSSAARGCRPPEPLRATGAGCDGERWATFDCYGTLVDWLGGTRATLVRLWPDAYGDALLLEAYMRIEPRVQARARRHPVPPGHGRDHGRVADELGLHRARRRGRRACEVAAGMARLPRGAGRPLESCVGRLEAAILSNTDADLLDSSVEAIGTRSTNAIVAGDIGSYKPSFGHWEAFFRRTGADRTRHVHVAASLFHDIEPCAKLGLPAVWIDRLNETSMVPRSARLPDLSELPETLERLMPA